MQFPDAWNERSDRKMLFRNEMKWNNQRIVDRRGLKQRKRRDDEMLV